MLRTVNKKCRAGKIHQTKREWIFPALHDDRVIVYYQIFIVVAKLSITAVVNDTGEKEIETRTTCTGKRIVSYPNYNNISLR